MVFKRDWKGQPKTWLLTAFDPKGESATGSTRIGAAASRGEARSDQAADGESVPRNESLDSVVAADEEGMGFTRHARDTTKPEVELPPRAPGESEKAWHARIMRESRQTMKDGLMAMMGRPTGEAKNQRDIGRGGLRHMWAKMQRAQDQAHAAFAAAMKVFDKAGKVDNLAAIHQWETGEEVTSAAHRLFFKAMEKAFNDRIERIRELSPGSMQDLIENYFPHLWEDPTRAQKWYQAQMAKSPLEGNKSYMKQRFHATIADGMKAGLKPVSTNPVDLVLAHMGRWTSALLCPGRHGVARAPPTGHHLTHENWSQ
jgi:hypothetical protein